ncbi:DUF2807 domain-containing protein [Myroides pelagicus]|uniref:GIN domain-containing protein n=1 Tax=Myroides pelagicus TaxID=270914 RepID=UPI002DBDF99E|nr:DUF2807 domain-containing protein [Myroides pelagicus]MEC4112648.1 DUF2807 domain-containing protein [Myroides pelagicus]
MKKVMLFFLLIGGSVFAQVKETRQVNDFSTIGVSQGIQVKFTYGEKKAIEVDAEDKELLDKIMTEVSANGHLSIYVEGKTVKKRNSVKTVSYGTNGKSVVVTISNPTLEGVSAKSSGKFELLNQAKARHFKLAVSSSGKYTGQKVTADELDIDLSSSGKATGAFNVMNETEIHTSSSGKGEFELTTNDLEVSVSSSGKLSLKGKAQKVDARVSSSGKIVADGLETKELEGSASSSGAMTFRVSEKVEAKASSSGKISYIGNPQVERKTSSGGKVHKIE